jgi:hypothetical protein
MDTFRFEREQMREAAEARTHAFDAWDDAVLAVMAADPSLSREQAEAEQRRRDHGERWHAARAAEIATLTPRIW